MKISTSYVLTALAAVVAMPTPTAAWSMGQGSLFFPSTSLMIDSPAARLLFDDYPFVGSPSFLISRPRYIQRRHRQEQRQRQRQPQSLAQQMDRQLSQQLSLARQMQQQLDRAFAPLYEPLQSMNSVSPVQSTQSSQQLSPFGSLGTSPRYQLTDGDTTFRLTVEVPGIKADNLDVSLQDDVLTVSGRLESSSEDGSSRTISRFSQSFTLDPSVQSDKLTADVQDGVLIVSAPKEHRQIESGVRKIPISGVGADGGKSSSNDTLAVTAATAESTGTVAESSMADSTAEANDTASENDNVSLDASDVDAPKAKTATEAATATATMADSKGNGVAEDDGSDEVMDLDKEQTGGTKHGADSIREDDTKKSDVGGAKDA